MGKTPIRVLVTGAAGQIGYALVLQIAKGDVFGVDQVGARVGADSCLARRARHVGHPANANRTGRRGPRVDRHGRPNLTKSRPFP